MAQITMSKRTDQKEPAFSQRESLKQLWLLQFKNPLIPRFGKEFFKSIPKTPGVYFMKNEQGELMYVGKAKSLRDRLRSYTHANPENSSQKVLRLIQFVRTIEWELQPDEKSALLRENQLLRTHRPFYNVLNTTPHTYLFVHLRLEENGIRIHLSMNQDETYPDIYGAFKGLGTVFRSQKALFRLLWATFHECRNGFEFPSQFTNRKKLEHFLFKLPPSLPEQEKLKLYRNLKKLYNGTSKTLLLELIELLLTQENLAPFMNTLLQQDIDTVLQFYNRCAHRNRDIKRKLKIKLKVLPQDQIDDFLVLLNSF